MSEAVHVYTPPQTAAAGSTPDEVRRFLDGSDLLTKTQALRLSTVDEAGWPHASLLSAGDMLMLPSGRARFVVFPQSKTAENLVRDGRVTMTLALDGGMCEVQMRARRLAHGSPDVPLAFFEAEVETGRIHKVPYATITSGITFSLHEPEAVLARWRRQILALRSAT
jgi:hypothetical protein